MRQIEYWREQATRNFRVVFTPEFKEFARSKGVAKAVADWYMEKREEERKANEAK